MNAIEIPQIKYVENLKFCQLLYSSFCSLKNKFKQRKMLLSSVIGLLCGEYHGTIAPLEQLLTTKYKSENIRYTICRSRIDYDSLQLSIEELQIKKAVELSKQHNFPILLIIDDMLIEKDRRSKELPKGGKKGKIEGYSLLTALIVVGQVMFPLVPRLCFRKCISDEKGIKYEAKTKKAIELIKYLVTKGIPTDKLVILTDSWYSSNELISLCNKIGCSYVLGLKSNRQLDKTRIDEYDKYVNHKNSHNLDFKEHEFNLYIRHGTLNNIKVKQNVLISKRRTKRNNKITFRHFLSNLENVYVINYWREKRWFIETYHQIFKDHFHPSQWRVHGEQRTKNLLILIGLSMFYSINYYLSNNNVDITGLERQLCHNIISESLNFMRATLISNREAWEKIFRKRE